MATRGLTRSSPDPPDTAAGRPKASAGPDQMARAIKPSARVLKCRMTPNFPFFHSLPSLRPGSRGARFSAINPAAVTLFAVMYTISQQSRPSHRRSGCEQKRNMRLSGAANAQRQFANFHGDGGPGSLIMGEPRIPVLSFIYGQRSAVSRRRCKERSHDLSFVQ